MPERLTRLGILVGVDGSSCSKTAARWAAGEAVMRGVPLTIVHVLDSPEGGWSGWGLSTVPLPADFGQQQQEYAREVIDDAITIIERTTQESGPLHITSEVLFLRSSPRLPTWPKMLR